METIKKIFCFHTNLINTIISFRSKKISTVYTSSNKSQSYINSNDCVYGITKPFDLIINDVKNGQIISNKLIMYISTNFSDEEKNELITEMNIMLNFYINHSVPEMGVY